MKPGYEGTTVKARSDFEIRSEQVIRSVAQRELHASPSVLLVGEVC